MPKSIDKTFLGMVLAHSGADAKDSDEWWHQKVIEAAKAAFDTGNELAALDVWFLCGSNSPAWAVAAKPINADDARHRAKKTGRHSRALRFTKDNLEHLARYNAVRVARLKDHLGWATTKDNVWDRAVELLSYEDRQAGIEDVRRSYKRVAKDIEAGHAENYWCPASAELRHLIRPDGNLGLVCYPSE